MICPNCGKEIEPQLEDDTFSYDYGSQTNLISGSKCYICPECEECLDDYEPEVNEDKMKWGDDER